MEPIVVFGAGLVLYCGFLAVVDAARDAGRGRAKAAIPSRNRLRPALRRSSCAVPGRADGGGVRWPAPLRGSV